MLLYQESDDSTLRKGHSNNDNSDNVSSEMEPSGPGTLANKL
jgi:hypothetical protein